MMQDVLTGWDWSVMQFPRYAMREAAAGIDSRPVQQAVTADQSHASPLPALTAGAHLRPERFGQQYRTHQDAVYSRHVKCL